MAGRFLAVLLALTAGAVTLPAAAQERPPSKDRIVITTTDESPPISVDQVSVVWIGDLRLPETKGEQAKRRWDEVHRRLDSRRGRRLRF